MVGALEQRAVTAAAAVASACGLKLDEAVVIHSASNVLVHLCPAPVVARVMTGTVALHDDPRRWLAREVSVLEFLAPSGLAVSPSRLIAPGPHCHDGLWMTFTEWIPDRRAGSRDPTRGRAERCARPGSNASGPSTMRCGHSMANWAGCVSFARTSSACSAACGRPTPRRARRSRRFVSGLGALRTTVFESRLPTQALHGDVSLRNLLCTPRRRVWNDFEDTFRGPVHWDLASYVGSFRIHGATERAVHQMLEGYGWDDADALAPFLAAQDVYDEIWRMYDRQRRRPISTQVDISPIIEH